MQTAEVEQELGGLVQGGDADSTEGSEASTDGPDSGSGGSSGGAADAEEEAEQPGPEPAAHVPNRERVYPKRPGGACPAGWMVSAVAPSTECPEGGALPTRRIVRKALPPLILPPAGVSRYLLCHASVDVLQISGLHRFGAIFAAGREGGRDISEFIWCLRVFCGSQSQ